MDEPFAALDVQTKAAMQESVLELWQSTGKTVVFVTHDLEEAVFLADRIVVLASRPGRVHEIVANPLLRPMSVLPAQRIAQGPWSSLRMKRTLGRDGSLLAMIASARYEAKRCAWAFRSGRLPAMIIPSTSSSVTSAVR